MDLNDIAVRYKFTTLAKAAADFMKHDKAARTAEVADRYRMAQIVMGTVDELVSRGDKSAVAHKKLADATGTSRALIYSYYRIARRISPAELQKWGKKLGNKFSWSELVYVSNRQDSRERNKILATVLQNDSSVRTVMYPDMQSVPKHVSAYQLKRIFVRTDVQDIVSAFIGWASDRTQTRKVATFRRAVVLVKAAAPREAANQPMPRVRVRPAA
jgi:hypothetical protein